MGANEKAGEDSGGVSPVLVFAQLVFTVLLVVTLASPSVSRILSLCLRWIPGGGWLMDGSRWLRPSSYFDFWASFSTSFPALARAADVLPFSFVLATILAVLAAWLWDLSVEESELTITPDPANIDRHYGCPTPALSHAKYIFPPGKYNSLRLALDVYLSNDTLILPESTPLEIRDDETDEGIE